MTDNLRRPLEEIARRVNEAGGGAEKTAKATDEVRKSVDKLGKKITDSSAIQSVDLLTEDEIE
ncbi:MAG: hypothetical protein RR547_13955, partial [Raoultibacter sp.]